MLVNREMLERTLKGNAIKMEKELAQSMIQDLSEKLKLVNKHGMLGVITTMTALLPLIRCEEGAPSLALATDQLASALIERVKDRAIIFEDDTYRNRERLFKGIPETRRFLDEATDYFGEEYTHVLRYYLGFEA